MKFLDYLPASLLLGLLLLTSLLVIAILVWKLAVAAKKYQQLYYRFKTQIDQEQETKRQLEVQQHQNDLQQETLAQSQQALHEEQVLNAQLEMKVAHLQPLQYEKTELQREASEYQELLVNANQHITSLEVKLASEKKISAEKSQLFVNARDQLKQDFQFLANKIFTEKASDLNKDSLESLTHLLDPLKNQLGDFKRKVEDVYDKETRDRQALYQQIDHLKALNQQMSQEAINLTQALKGDNKIQGNWGEVVLERILEESGLRKGYEYDTQVSLVLDGRRFQPDVIIRLPDSKEIIIDSKVSLVGYERYYSEKEQALKDQHILEHVQSLRHHIKGLSGKNYDKLEAINSLDFVLLFVPIEAAFLLAIEQDKNLFRYALQRNIVLVSPSTLLVTLRTIRNIWRIDQQSQNAQLIASRGAELYDKFVGFIESMDALGHSLNKAQQTYNQSYKRLATGRGNLVSQADALTKLGVTGKKQIPQTLLDGALEENNANNESHEESYKEVDIGRVE